MIECDFEVLKIGISLFPKELLSNEENINSLLDLFENEEKFLPTHWGTFERPKFKYDRYEILNKVLNEKKDMIFLHRNKAPKYTCYFDLSNKDDLCNYFTVQFNNKTPKKYWDDIYEFSDKIAEVIKPRFGVSGLVYNAPIYIKSKLDELLNLMLYTSQESQADFPKCGVRGLGMKTYFGDSLLNLYGKDIIMDIPAVINRLKYGGVSIDLSENHWLEESEILFNSWKICMEYLNKFDILASFTAKESGCIDFKSNELWDKNKKSLINRNTAEEGKSKDNISKEKQIFRDKINEVRRNKNTLLDEVIKKCDLSFSDLEDLSAERLEMEDVNIKASSFLNSELYSCNLEKCNLEECDFERAGIGASYFIDCNFNNSNMKYVVMNVSFCTGSSFDEVDFSNGELRGTCIDNASVKNAKITNVDAKMSSFNGSDLSGADLSNSNFEKASFLNCKLEGVKWKGANIDNAKFDIGIREKIEKFI
ncbi:pentapeptide repeat-containing protein [Clostridium botulinum]|nr:pentapeptide repeat-containing protein [Clostridium botulinum]